MKYPACSYLPLAAVVTAALAGGLTESQAARFGLNFQSQTASAVTVTAFDVPAADWFSLPLVANSNSTAFSSSAVVNLPGAGPVTIEWSAVNTWAAGEDNSGIGEVEVARGYLDDTGEGYRVTIDGLRNSVRDYKLTLIASTDGGSGFDDAVLTYATGPSTIFYQSTVNFPTAGGYYARSDESPLISAETTNNKLTITSTAGSGRGTLAGFIIDYTPATANVPVIETEPVAPVGTIYTGQTFSLSVAASGTNLTYQWRKGGVPITGNPSATTPVFTAANVTAADTGSYDVVVSGTGTPDTSVPVAINVSALLQPQFTVSPLNQNFYVGYPATFTAEASGGEMTYVWKKGETTVGTGPSFQIPAITEADAGTYTVTATNPVGNVSASAVLTLKTPVPGSYEAVQARQKPLLWYRYSETDGSGIQALTPNTGSLGSALTAMSVMGDFGAAGALSGSSNNAATLRQGSGRIVVGYHPALNTAQFTAEAWVKPAVGGAAGENLCVLSCGDFLAPRAGWLIYQQPTGWNLRFYNQNDVNVSLNITGGGVPVADTWYHLAVTFNGTTATLYVNGVPTSGEPTSYVPGTAGPFSAGARSDVALFWKGSLDEIAYYPTALSQANVQARYANGISSTPAVPYESLVTGAGASLYLRLNDPVFHAASVANSGTFGAAANGTYRGNGIVPGQPLITVGLPGPVPAAQPGFDPANKAMGLSDGAAVVNTVVPMGNQVTVTTWIKREAISTTGDLSWLAWLGDGGMHLHDGTEAIPNAELRYHWKGDKWGWRSGLFVPADIWTFTAMVIEPDKATFYMSDTDEDGKPVLRSSSQTTTHAALANNSLPSFGGNQPNWATRNFIGQLDESAVYNRSLSRDEVAALFLTGMGVPLTIDIAAGGVIDDTKPTGTPIQGLNFGSVWQPASEDALAFSRQGVQEFTESTGSRILLPPSPPAITSPTGTLAFWIKASAPTGTGTAGSMIYDYRTTEGAVVTLLDSGALFIQPNPGNTNEVTDPNFIADDNWHHVAVTWNQDAAGSISVFIDGNLSTEKANANAWSWPADTAPMIGWSRDPYWKKFNGQLDDFRIYNRILSAAEISQIRNSGDVVAPTSLAVRYDFGTAGSGLTLSWPFGVLETSTTMQTPTSWTPVDGAASPFPVNPAGARFFRAKLP